MFVTSILLPGNLGTPKGLATADEICYARAELGGLPNAKAYKAWLSDATQGPLDRFTLLPAKPYVLRTGERIAESLTDLVINGPGEGIRVDEFGAPIPPSYVWTSTTADGVPNDPDSYCSGWTEAQEDQLSLAGFSHLPLLPEDDWKQWQQGKWWTHYAARQCSKEARLYCFEQ